MGGTVLNQTGQAIEIIGIWMAVYLLYRCDLGVHELVQRMRLAGAEMSTLDPSLAWVATRTRRACRRRPT
jgi:hypothetical protein